MHAKKPNNDYVWWCSLLFAKRSPDCWHQCGQTSCGAEIRRQSNVTIVQGCPVRYNLSFNLCQVQCALYLVQSFFQSLSGTLYLVQSFSFWPTKPVFSLTTDCPDWLHMGGEGPRPQPVSSLVLCPVNSARACGQYIEGVLWAWRRRKTRGAVLKDIYSSSPGTWCWTPA